MPHVLDFLRLLDPDPRLANRRYAELRTKLIRFFEWRRCPDAENLAQETILRTLDAVARGTQLTRDDNTPFFFAVAKNILHESRRSPHNRVTEEIEESMLRSTGDQRIYDSRIRYQQLERRHLAVLDPDDRELLTRYHLEDREELAREVRLSPGALRVKVHRLRQRVLETMAAESGQTGP